REHSDERVAGLGTLIRELFVLRPRPRAIRRAVWLAEHGTKDGWLKATKKLSKFDPATTRLDPALLERLRWRASKLSVAGLTEYQPGGAPQGPMDPGLPPAPIRAADATGAGAKAAARRQKDTEKKAALWVSGAVAIAILVMICLR